MNKTPYNSVKKTGFSHFFAAGGYSWQGFKFMTGEIPFRHELFATAALLITLFLLAADPLHIVLTFVLCLVTIAFEALNSTIELIVDRVSPEYAEFAKNAKDVGSFAVCAMIIATGTSFAFAIYATL